MTAAVAELAPTVDAATLACQQIIGTVLLVEGMPAPCRALSPEDMVRASDITLWRLAVELDACGKPVALPALIDLAQQHGVVARLPDGGSEGWHRPYIYAAQPADRLPQLVEIVRSQSIRRDIERDATALICGSRAGRTVIELIEDAARLTERARAATAQPADPCVTLAAVKRESVTWLSHGRLARSKITMVDGMPGLGKSTVTMDWIARVTTGRALPGDVFAPAASDVLIIAHEDGAGDTHRPRGEAAGANLDRVHVWSADDVPRLPSDVDRIADAIRRHHVALVVIDPVVAYLDAECSANSDQDVRRALLPLAQVATDTGACIVLVRHLRKSAGTALERGGGSIGWAGLARVVLTVGADPDDPDARVVAVAKCNVAKRAPSLRYRIVDADGAGRVEWLGECTHTADDVTSDPIDRAAHVSKRDDAADMIREALADGEWHRQREIIATLAAAGIAEKTWKRAKATVGVESRQRDREWWWGLRHAGTPDTVAPWPSDPLTDGGPLRDNNITYLGSAQGQRVTEPHTPPDYPRTDGGPEDVI